MKILELLWEFLKIGAFAFGGGYAAIPLIRDAVLAKGWMDDAQLMNLLGISESTPGPIMVNAATMAGFRQSGVFGAAVATLGVILPSFLIMLVVPRLQRKWREHRVVRLALEGMKPCLAGVICATGARLLAQVAFPAAPEASVDVRALAILAALTGVSLLSRKFRKKPASPIFLIALAAALGMAIY